MIVMVDSYAFRSSFSTHRMNNFAMVKLSAYRDDEVANGKFNDRRKSRSDRPSLSSSSFGDDLNGITSSSSSKRKANPVRNDGIRQARISRSIRDELSEIICEGDIKATAYPEDDLLKSTCITEVEISPDLAYAKIFISVIGNSVQRRQGKGKLSLLLEVILFTYS